MVSDYFKPLAVLIAAFCLNFHAGATAIEINGFKLEPGDASLQQFLLPDIAPSPADNPSSPEKIALGQRLFFDTALSQDGTISCGSCHSPTKGWSDDLPLAKGLKQVVLKRASPSVTNTGFNPLQMWDGRFASLEEQALGPMHDKNEMSTDFEALIAYLQQDKSYQQAFAKAFPGEPISKGLIAKAIAAFERTVVSNNSNFDQWVKGDAKAMTKRQIEGFALFVDENKANCLVCHSAPNFTDNGFHNIGVSSIQGKDADLGRYSEKPLNSMKGAFKTPSLRDIANTAPYFHDGSAKTLRESVAHYVNGHLSENLSPNFKVIDLSDDEIDLVTEFLQSLSSN